jgi:hypothetical protein
MNLDAIRHRVANGPVAVPALDGNFYSDVAQAVQDRANLLDELDRRPDLRPHELADLRLVLDDFISGLEHKLTDPEVEDDDKQWTRVRLAGAERLMDRLNNL